MPFAPIAALAAPAATSGGFLSGLSSLAGPISGLLGGVLGNNALAETKSDVLGLTDFNPTNQVGPGGIINANTGAITEGLNEAQFRNFLLQNGGNLLQGGQLFNNPQIQTALEQNNLGGALNQQNTFNQQTLGANALGGLQGLNNQTNQLGSAFAQQALGGLQDQSGQQANLFGQANQNFANAGNTQGIFDQQLQSFRDAAQPQNDRFIQSLENRLFSQGRLGSTGGAQQFGQAVDAIGRQDLGFQNAARDTALQQQQFLGGLGAQQAGLGAQLFGQNLQGLQNTAQNALGFGAQGAAQQGQQFGQNQQSSLFNQTQGQNRLQNAINIFGLGNDLQGQGFDQGISGQQTLNQQNLTANNQLLGLLNAEANRINATGGHAGALADLGSNQGGLLGGIFDGIGGIFGG